MIDAKGRVALITGASRGIGYLAAKALAAQGCELILHGRAEAHLERVLSEVRALGVRAHAAACELSDPADAERMLKGIDSLGLDVDIVLNNAGVQVAYRTDYLNTPASDYERSFFDKHHISHDDRISLSARYDRAGLWTHREHHERHSARAPAGWLFRKQGGAGQGDDGPGFGL